MIIFGMRKKEIWREDNGEGSRLKICHRTPLKRNYWGNIYVHVGIRSAPPALFNRQAMNRNEGSHIAIVFIFRYYVFGHTGGFGTSGKIHQK